MAKIKRKEASYQGVTNAHVKTKWVGDAARKQVGETHAIYLLDDKDKPLIGHVIQARPCEDEDHHYAMPIWYPIVPWGHRRPLSERDLSTFGDAVDQIYLNWEKRMIARAKIGGRLVKVEKLDVEWVLLEDVGDFKAGQLFIGYLSGLLNTVQVTRWVPGRAER